MKILAVVISFLFICFLWAEDEEESPPWFPQACEKILIQQDFHLVAVASGNNLDGKEITVHIAWKHHQQTVDTFELQSSEELWVYTTSPWMRYLYRPHEGALRSLAQHHLRERIFNSALRLDDLELLSHGQMNCDSTIQSRTWHTAFSKTTYQLMIDGDSLALPDSLTTWGYLGLQRTIRLSKWHPWHEFFLPLQMIVEENESLRMHVRVQGIIPLDHPDVLYLD